MNSFFLILYIYALFSVLQGRDNRGEVDVFQGWHFNDPASGSLYEYLDQNINPCDNFYQFSCGKWIETQKFKYEDYSSFNIINTVVNYKRFIKEFEEGKYNRESKAINNVYNLRRKCNKLPEDKIKDCQSEILDFGTYALTALFLKKNEIKSKQNGDYDILEDMIKRIKSELEYLIHEKMDIFDLETTDYFLHKLKKMKFDKNYEYYELSNVDKMEDCYQNIGEIVFKNSSIEDVLYFIRQGKKDTPNEKHILGTCKGRFFIPNDIVYDYVYDSLNEPSFSINFPMSLNYGYLGATIAHEMLHAFDSETYNRTFEGNEKIHFNVTQMSVNNFEERSKCFVKQYGMQKESITNKNINGLLTLDENIADNGGLKLAHRAYLRYHRETGDNNTKIRGFEKFTNEQLFFISFGRKRCEYKSKNNLENSIRNSVHTPGEIRTNVALSNYRPFSYAFDCPINSKMNPENKCELWENQK